MRKVIILLGKQGSGKSTLLSHLAALNGKELVTYHPNKKYQKVDALYIDELYLVHPGLLTTANDLLHETHSASLVIATQDADIAKAFEHTLCKIELFVMNL